MAAFFLVSFFWRNNTLTTKSLLILLSLVFPPVPSGPEGPESPKALRTNFSKGFLT